MVSENDDLDVNVASSMSHTSDSDGGHRSAVTPATSVNADSKVDTDGAKSETLLMNFRPALCLCDDDDRK